MLLTVLGCSGSIAAGCRTTSFLLDGDILIDAGTGVGDLPLVEMAKIDHILISHSHLDHVLGIGLLADAVLRLRRAASRPAIQVHALPETLHALRTHILNGVIWPDFTRLPSPEAPTLALRPFAIGDLLELNGKRIEVLSAVHTVPAVGFAVEGRRWPTDGGAHPDAGRDRQRAGAADSANGDDPVVAPSPAAGWWVYTGDTGPNPKLWSRLREMKVAHLVIETAFGDAEASLARISQHLCPAELGLALAQLPGAVDVHITHIKPGESAAVMAEIGRLLTPHRVSALSAGDTVRLA